MFTFGPWTSSQEDPCADFTNYLNNGLDILIVTIGGAENEVYSCFNPFENFKVLNYTNIFEVHEDMDNILGLIDVCSPTYIPLSPYDGGYSITDLFENGRPVFRHSDGFESSVGIRGKLMV